jgi:hypothetical protein
MYSLNDPKNAKIHEERKSWFESSTDIETGDVIIFADGTKRRVSYIWRLEDGWEIQTSTGGSFYIGKCCISFSGSLYRSVPKSTCTLTEGKEEQPFWFFDQDWPRAHSAVHCKIPCRVWKCSVNAPLY